MSKMRFEPNHDEAKAGVELCRLRGLDPDEIMYHGPDDGSGLAVSLRSPRWNRAALEIHNHMLITEAIRNVVGNE